MGQFLSRVAYGQLDLAAADSHAEKLRGQIRNLVRLVEDDGICRPEQIAEAVFLEREIRQQKVVIDDDHVGLDGGTAGIEDMAARVVAAPRTQAVVPRGRDLRPERMRIPQVGYFGEITALRDGGPPLQARQRAVASAHQAALARELFEAVVA